MNMIMRRTVLALVVAIGLSGCANVERAWDTLTTSQVSPTVVIVAANTFDGLEATATNYLRLPRCTGANGPVCRDPRATSQIIPAVRAGRAARNALEDFLRSHPGQLGPSGLYDSLIAASNTLQAIFTQYNVRVSR